MTATARFHPTSFFGTLLLIVSMAVGVARGNDSPLEKTPAGISSSDWEGIRAAHSASLHAFVPTNDGGWKGRNPGQQWTTEFDGRGFETKPTGAEWRWGLELRSYGFGETQQVVGRKPEVTVEGQCLSYQWDDAVKEWFVNDSRGLEHGFDVARRPAGAAEGEGLDFVLATRGTLRASVAADAQSVVYENADGAAVVTYAGLKVWDADGNVLPSRFVAGPQGSIILRVEESAARYPIVIDPIAQQAYLKASNTGFADKFGTAVAISGDTVVVGANEEDSNATGVNGNQSDNSFLEAGAAYIFVRNAGVWTQQAYLKASNTGEYDGFGAAVAISGDTVIIGASSERSNATGVNGNQSDNSATDAGAAYVFTRTGSTWTQQAYLKASNTTAGYRFGSDVAVSGDTVVVGSVGEGSNATGVNGNPFDYGSVNSGAAYVFTRAGGTWSQQAYLKASNTGAGDAFGTAVSISGDTVVITAEEERSNATGVNGNQSDNSAPDAGAAYVFTRSGSTWSQQAYLKASNAQAGDFFGGSAAISGDTIVIGAGLEGSAATGVNGNQSDNSAVWAGAAYVFNRSGGTWSQQAYLKASNTGGDDRFGDSVAISGDLILVGAYNEDSAATGVNGNQSDNSASSAGAAYLFGRSGGVWTQQDYIKASNTQATDWFGVDVAISGGTAVIGASLEDSAATGIGGNGADNSLDRSGAAYTFFTAIPLPDINVRGNGTDITDGDTTPSAADHTQFTDTAVGGSSTRVFTIQNTGTADLFFQNVTFSGPHAADFSLLSPAGYSVSPGFPTTFTVQISPSGTGLRAATVHIASNDPDGENPYSFDISGTGIVPLDPDYTVTTAGGVLTVTDVSGNGDILALSQPSAGDILFTATGRNFSLNGGATTVNNSGNISLSGITSVVVNAAAGADTITLTSFSGSFPALTLNGGTGDDTITFNGDITFAGGANLNVDLQDDDANPGVDRITFGSGADLSLSGTGAATLKASRDVALGNGTIDTVNGALTIEANQQAVPTTGDFTGVSLNGSIAATGAGEITVKGRGGDSGTSCYGIENRGIISGGTAGTLIVQGTGGTSTSDFASGGVRLFFGSITSLGATVNVIGTGGGSGSARFIRGVEMLAGTITSVSATASVNVTGSGGTQNTPGITGVLLSNDSTITSGGGAVRVTGTAGSYGTSANFGVFVLNSSITAGGSGTVRVEGTASGGVGSSSNGGVSLNSAGVISSGGGRVDVIGQGGTGSSSNGIELINSGALITSGGGDVTLSGSSLNPTGDGFIMTTSTGSVTTAINGGNIVIVSDRINIAGGTISANAASTVTLKPMTVARAVNFGAADTTTLLGLSDAELDRVTAGRIEIGDGSTGDITVSAPVSRAAATDMLLFSSGDITFTTGNIDTGGGLLDGDVSGGSGAIRPDFAGTDATAAEVSGSGMMEFNLTGTTADTQYQQLKVVGEVVLTDLDLSLTGAYVPVGGNSFTLIDNDGTDAITGTFTGQSQNSTLTFNGVLMRLNYAGGDGNDLVLSVANNPPTDISLTATSIPENNAVNAAVGTLSTTDADAGDSHTYALVSGAGDMDNGSFTIDGDLLRLTPVADFETKSSYSVRIQTSDGAATYSEAFLIAITNVNEMPSFTKGGNRSHVFGTNTTQTVTNWATSIEDGDSTVTQDLTFNVTNNNNALFTTQPAISATGTLTYTPSGSAGTATVSVTLSDDATINGNAALTTAVQTFTITVAAAADYTVTTAGSVLTVTDISGNTDTLALSQPSAGDILFTATGRSFSLNGGANTTNSSGSISLNGITSVVVNTGVGADTITLTAFTPPGGFPGLTLHGGTGDDTIVFNGDITFTAGANLNVDLQDDDAAPGVDRITVVGNANLLLSGAGGVVFKVSRDVLFSSGSVLEVEDGNILMEANQQTTPTTGGFSGLNLSNARVEATGIGSIALRGRTGNSGVYIKGVVIQDGSQVLARSGGIVIVGNGQSGHTNIGNFGVGIGAGGSSGVVRSVGGNVQITGVGGSDGGATLNLGVGIENASEVSATGEGTVTIEGTGGNVTGTGSQNHGVYVTTTGANVTTEAGLLTISGTAGGGVGSSNNIGVFLFNGTIGTAGGDLVLIGNGSSAGSGLGVRVNREIQTNGGEIEITGNGGASGGIGVDLQGSLLAAGGSISVTGVAAGAAVGQDGISVTAPMITSGAGSITIHGTASPAGGGQGVLVGGSVGEVTTGGGSISITGIGGGGGFGSFSYGVFVNNRPISGPGAGQTLMIHGTGGAGAVSSTLGVIITSSNAQVQTSGGDLSITGIAGGNGTSGAQGCYFENGCLLRAGGDGNVTLVGIGGGSVSADAGGIRGFNAAIEVAGAGDITLTGTGGDGTGDGISSNGGFATHGGDLTLIGAGAAQGGIGINVQQALQATGSTGGISLTGTGGAAAGADRHGVRLTNSVSTVNGPITITGTAGGQDGSLGSRGISKTGGNITVGGAHDLILSADSIDLSSGLASAAGDKIFIRQATNSTEVRLGGIDVVTGSPLVLGLSEAELDRLQADEVVIGDANSGAIEVRDVISPLSYQGLRSAKALRFTSTGGFTPLITSAAQFQRILVDGAVTIDPDATLAGSVQSGFTPASTDVFPIIQNLGTGATTGTFAGKPQGSPVTLTNLAQPLRITYAGGPDNNDIQLFSASLPTVTGNALTITNGDIAPSAADHTDFGSALIDGGMVSRTFTILNSGSADLNLTGNPRVALSGSPAFTVTSQPASATVAADGSQTFIITFDPMATGAATATVSIANDSPFDNPYSFAIAGTGLASTNADLSSLSLSAGTLSPAFSAATTAYSINVPNTTSTTTVTATRAEANATLELQINGGGFTPLASGVASGSLPLNVGANPIDVRVTAQDGTTVKTYTTTVTRAAPLPILSITDVSRAEGDVGETDFSFEVLLDAPAPPGGVTFDITTADGTASSPDDYLTETLSGRTIPEGAQGFGFVVTIVGDSMPEPNETFFVNVTNIVGAVAGDAQGLGTILNDDLTADLSITKSNGVSSSTPGSPLTYTITASNAGPDPATATVIDTLPAILTGATWTAVGAGGGTVAASGSGNINEAVNLPAGGSVTFTVNATIAPSATTSLQNTASVVIGAGVTDPNGNNNEATDTDTLTPQADLSITKNDGVTSATPGGSVTYTITASNAGPSDVTGATVTDTLPAALTGTWTSVTAGGATATASGSGNINDTVNLPAGGSVTYTVVCSISASATGNLVNTSRVSSDVADPNENNNEATDTDALSGEADLSITKSNGVTTAVPGESVTYTITASNAGPSNTTATVTDIMPGVLTGTWTAVGAGGGTASASGSGDINDLVTLPAGGSVTYTVTATIDPAATGTLTNTATIAGPLDDPDTDNNEAVDTDTLTPRADLSITKTDGTLSVAPGAVVTYTIIASNAGPSDVSGATVADAVPASLSGVTWTAVGAGGGTGTASGTGSINDTVILPAGGSVTYTLTGLLDPGAFDILSNTATVTAPGGVVDPEGNNDSATDTDTITTVVSITATDAEVDENAPDGGTWRISRNGTAGDLLVNLAVEGTSTTSATDWTATVATFVSTGPNGTGTATIPDGSAFVDIVLTPTDDVAAEADETVVLTIAASALYTSGSAIDNEITIAANDFGVTNTDDSGEGSLRQAIENANAIAGADTVTFHDLMADAVPDVILLTTGELFIRESLTIAGTGADLLTVSGNDASRIFSLLIAGNVTLRGMKLTEGNAIQSNISGAGGAVYCDTTTLLLDAVHVTGNRGDGQAGGLGLYNNSNVTIRDCTIDNNVAEGTSLAAGGILHAGASLNLVNSTISNNRARNSTSTVAAGGIYVGNSAVIVHSTITGNAAANSQPAGGLFLTSEVELSHNLIAGNTNGHGLSDLSSLGATITANHNLVGDSATSGGLVDGTDGNLVGDGGSGALDLISLLDPVLRDNGGTTPTHKLIPGSSAVDGGDPAFDVNSFSPALVDDQRGPGFSRVLKGQLLSSANLVDIGAYELIAAPEFSDADLRIKADGDPIDLTVATGATPPGGTFSGPGVSGGSFHPSGLAPGTYLLTYTYEDEFGAQNSSGFAVTVMATSTVLKVSPPKRFTATQIGRTSKMRQVSVSNEGDHAAIDLRTFVTGSGRKDYLVDQPALSRLAPSAVTTFRAGFRPKREGNRRATVTVVSGNAPPVIITLRGKGLIPRNGGIRPPRATDHPN